MAEAPTGFGHALCAMDLYVGPSNEVAIIGEPSSDQTRTLAAEVTGSVYRPNVVMAVARPGDDRASLMVPLLRERDATNGAPTAYVCQRFACKLPVTDADALRTELDG